MSIISVVLSWCNDGIVGRGRGRGTQKFGQFSHDTNSLFCARRHVGLYYSYYAIMYGLLQVRMRFY